MLTKWFSPRTPRPSVRPCHFRPQLEYLEGRLAPSSMGMGQGNDNDQGDDNGKDNNGGPPGHVNVHDNDHENIHINDRDDFDLEDNDAFGVVLNNLNVNQVFALMGTPQAQLTEILFSSLGQAVATTPGATVQNALTLVTNEVQLGQDTGMLLQGVLSGGSVDQSLVTTIHNLQSAIQSNPLEASAAGQVAGIVAFDIGLNATLPQLAGHS
ncbi:MAG TPA: hypothetical protein VH643_34645 [Gemmataceae bacterium]|jgi:hypothetical protein